MNRIVLVGRLTKCPELKKTQNNNSVVNFTIAVNRTFANANGEREADFINCVAWNKTAENMAVYLSKGSLIGVDGRIQTRSYEGNDGKRVYITEVFVDNLQFLESKQGNNQSNENEQANTSQNGFVAQNGSNDVLSDFGISDDDFDGELPF